MESSDYTIAWLVYCGAAAVLAWLCWLVLRRISIREIAWLLEFWLLALMFTPWYVLPDQEILAPAVIVFVMDVITVDTVSAIRALIPLVMALLLGLVMTLVMSIVYRIARRRRRTADGD